VKFGVEFSVQSGELEQLRSFITSLILRKDSTTYRQLQLVMTECMSNYPPYVLIGREQLGYDESDKLMVFPAEMLYLAGLEFYLRFTLYREYSGVDKLRYVHQFAVEGHLMGLALDAVQSEEHNQQGLLCLHLMMRSQGWSWLVSTLLPQIFTRMQASTESTLCRYLEVVADLASVEVAYQRADLHLIKANLIPTLHGLLWTAPTITLKGTLAEALLKLAAVSPLQVIELLEKWLPTVQANGSIRLHSELDAKLTFLRQKNKVDSGLRTDPPCQFEMN